jgi:uncharacterized protein YbjT (DUF2867 family)
MCVRAFDADCGCPAVTTPNTASGGRRVNRSGIGVRTHAVKRILLTGATGYVGGNLLGVLLDDGHHVRALARDAGSARGKLPSGVEVAEGDVVSGEGVSEALDGIEVAYYLVHSMGRGSGSTDDFAERDRQAAENFGAAARDAGVERIVYLGGLEGVSGGAKSEHLRSREEVARVLAEHVRTVHVRAAMIIGEGSASFVMLRSLVHRLPVMVVPRWLDTRTQPVAIEDVIATLAALAELSDPPGEVQVGGADVLSYRDMMQRYAEVAGKRVPLVITVPVLTPRLSSYWVALVTPVEMGLVRPLVDGLTSEMIVHERPPPGLNDHPLGFDEAVGHALGLA